jgi:predicted TIM-barrel enzyme
VRDFLKQADGVIVGTSLKKSGGVGRPVDERKVARLVRAMGK